MKKVICGQVLDVKDFKVDFLCMYIVLHQYQDQKNSIRKFKRCFRSI